MTDSARPPLVAIGRIRTAHGLRGEVKVLSYSGEFDHFEALTTVTARKGQVEKDLAVESTRWSGDQLLMKFRGLDQPETAKALADFELWVEPQHAAKLEEGEVYLKDLIGCRLVHEGAEQGVVTGYLEGGHTELLEVKKADGSTSVVPFAERYLGEIDLTGRTVELKVLWILD